MATLNLLLFEPDIRTALVGVPLFTHTMIAFSAVFLLKVAWKWSSTYLYIDERQVLDLVQQVINTMSSVQASDKHLTNHIANGLRQMLAKLRSRDSGVCLQPSSSNDTMRTTENVDLGERPIGRSFEFLELDFPETWNEVPTSLDFFPVRY